MPALIAAANALYEPTGFRRLAPRVFDLEHGADLRPFLHGDVRCVQVGNSSRTIKFDSMRRTAVGLSRLGTSLAVAVGASAFALQQLDRHQSR